MLAEELMRLRVEESHVEVVPLNTDSVADPAGAARAVEDGLVVDAAIEMHSAVPEKR